MKDQSLTKTFHKPQWQMSALLVVIAAAWIAAYNLIQPFANWLTYSFFHLDSVSHLGESIAFFLYDLAPDLRVLKELGGLAFRCPGLQRHIRCCPASRFKLQPEIVDRQVVLHLALAGKEYPLDFLTVNYPVFGES